MNTIEMNKHLSPQAKIDINRQINDMKTNITHFQYKIQNHRQINDMETNIMYLQYKIQNLINAYGEPDKK